MTVGRIYIGKSYVNAGRVREDAGSLAIVYCPYAKVVLIARAELLERAGHRQGQCLHLAHVLPQGALRPQVGGLLVSKNLRQQQLLSCSRVEKIVDNKN